MDGMLGSSCGPSSSAFSSASSEFTSSPSWPTSENNFLDQSQVLILQVPSEADQPAGAVHHGLRGAARRSWFLSCQDGQQVCRTRIVEIVNIVTWYKIYDQYVDIGQDAEKVSDSICYDCFTSEVVEAADIFVTTALMVVVFTIFIQVILCNIKQCLLP